MKNLHKEMIKFHEENFFKKQTMLKYSRISKLLHNILDCIVFFAGISVIILPVLVSIIGKIYFLPFGFILPFTDPKKFIGYGLNLIYQYFQTYITIFGFLGFSKIYLTFIIHGCNEIAIIVDMIADLNDLILSKITKKDEELQEYNQKCFDQLKAILVFLGKHLM